MALPSRLSSVLLLLSLSLVQLCIARAQQPIASNPSLHVNAILPNLFDATLDDLTAGLDAGAFTGVDLVNAYIARIEDTNDELHAVTEINPDAISIAAELDLARQNGESRGPLHGIPVLIKNNIATDDKTNTTAGSYALVGAKPPSDSTVAAKLREAGVVILGKANLSQWSGSRSSITSDGWSAHGGQTKGAYYQDQDPCGSSAGSGVASSIGLAWASLGTETAGSIQCPSSYNNVVGIKPTVGLTSRYLVVPVSEHQDTVGPIARTVKDAAHLLNAIAGPDKNDNYTSAIPFPSGSLPDYVAACGAYGLKGKRIGVTRSAINNVYLRSPEASEILLAQFNSSLDIIRGAGATVIDDIPLPGWEALLGDHHLRWVSSMDLTTDLKKYFAKLATNPNNITDLASLQNFTRTFPLEGYPKRDTGFWELALGIGGGDNTSPSFWGNRTRALYLAGPLGLLGALANNSLDAIVLPGPSGAVIPGILGTPAVTVPMGRFPDNAPVVRDEFGDLNRVGPNLPIGLSFLGPHFSEERLIGLAYDFEQRTLVRKKIKPRIKPKTELKDIVYKRLAAAGPGELK